MEEKVVDIKETKELLSALEVAAIAIAKIAKDKKVNAEDLPVLIELATEFETLVSGFSGLSEIPTELKDLDEAEVIALISKLYSIAKAVKAELA